LKGNTRSNLITDDFKNLNIHNWTPPEENSRGVFQKFELITISHPDCVTFKLNEKRILQVHLAVTNNQYAFLIVIGACTFN